MKTETQVKLEAAWELAKDYGVSMEAIPGCDKLRKRNWLAIRYKVRGKTYKWCGEHVKPPTSPERIRQMVAKFIECVEYSVDGGEVKNGYSIINTKK